MAEYVEKKLRLNADLGSFKKGMTITIKCEKTIIGKEKKEKFIPLDRYWRDRLKDSKIDKCVNFVESEEPKEDEVGTDVKKAAVKSKKSKKQLIGG